MNTTNYEMCRSYLGTIDSVSTEATTLIQSMKAYNADQQGQAKSLYSRRWMQSNSDLYSVRKRQIRQWH